MKIATLTAFITPFLPFLLNLGGKAAEKATETAAGKFGEAAWSKAQAVWEKLSPKVESKEAAKEAATDVANHPEDEDLQIALRVQLKKLLDQDEELLKAIAHIFQEDAAAGNSGTQIVQNVTGNQNQVIGQVKGGNVFGNVQGSVILEASASHRVASQTPTKPEGTIPQKTILILAANPKGTSPLRLDEEVREIQQGLERSKQRDRFSLQQKWAVRPQDVRRALLDYKPQILHFSGHGLGSEQQSQSSFQARELSAVPEDATEPEGLVLEDEVGQLKLVSSEALANLFQLFADQLECVVLNACYSEIQANAIAQHIPYVVGMKRAIGDRAAIEFAIGFYDALLAGESIEFAYKLGCNAIQMAGIPEHLTPTLKQKLK